MNKSYEGRTCANCYHFRDIYNFSGDIYNDLKSSCAIGCDMHAPKCPAFAWKSDDLAKFYTKDLTADLVSTPLMGITIFVATLFILQLALFESANGSSFFWLLVLIGVVCIAFGCILRLTLRLRRNNLKEEFREEIEAEIRDEKWLTRNAIKEFLVHRRLSPEPIAGNDGFIFTSNDVRFSLFYDRKHDLTIRYGCELEEGDAKIAQKIINTYDGEVFGAFRKVYEFTKGGEVKYALMCEIDFFAEYVDYFERAFPRYLHSVELAVNNLFVSLNRYEREGQNENNSRGDIYNPEYRLIPRILQGVKTDHLFPDALVDEEWIRREIQTRCSSNECKEEWNSFKINRVNKFGDYKLIIYQFPEPKVAPEAKYGAVLLNTNTLDSNYYTLEMSVEDRWYYGGVSEDRHLNYGEAESADLDRFIEWIFSNDKQIEASTDYNK